MDKIAEQLEKILMEHLYRGDLVASFTENGCCMVCGFPIDRDRIKCGIKPIALAIEKYILDAKPEVGENEYIKAYILGQWERNLGRNNENNSKT